MTTLPSIRSPVTSIRSPIVTITLAGLVSGVLWVGIPTDPLTARILAITTFCIILWVLTPIAPAYTGLVGIGLISIAFSTELAFTGFQAPATWLIGFGLLIGEATRQSGLAARVGHWLTVRSLPAGERSDPVRAYRQLLLSLSIGAFLLALVIPSALVRVLLLAPILIEAGSAFDSRRAKTGLFLGPLFTTFYGSSGILTADLPNIIITGIGQSVADHTVSWTEWLVHMFPVMGVARALVVIGLIYVLYRPRPGTRLEPIDTDVAPVESEQRRMLLFLFIGTTVWMTDFIHGFHPVIGALVVVVLAFLPTIGIANFQRVGEEVDYSIIFFVAAVLAIGDALAFTGFSEDAASYLLEFAPADGSLTVVLVVVFFATVLLTFLIEGLAVASVLTPVVIEYAEALGLPLTPVMMAEAMALSTYFFPYQSAVLIAILAQDVVDSRELIRTTALCSLATIVLLVPVQFLYFSILY